MKKFIYSSSPDISGIKIILDQLNKSTDVKIINNLNDSNLEDLIIPYGIIDCFDVLEKNKNIDLALLVDSPTLCYKSVSFFYLKYRVWNPLEILKNMFNYFKYLKSERLIIQQSKQVVVVSPYDKTYLERKYNKNNIICIQNGVKINDNQSCVSSKKDTNILKLGVISHWGPGAFLDIKWFIDKYLPKLLENNNKLELIIAGKSAEKYMVDYWETSKGVCFIGEVDKLSDFFCGIDIYLSTVRKSCGVLNKVLDAWAHQKPVIGLPHNFYAFPNLRVGYRTFTNVLELDKLLNEFSISNEQYIKELREVKSYLLEYHDWQINYKFLNELLK